MEGGEDTQPQPTDSEDPGHEGYSQGAGQPYEYTPLPEPDEPAEPGGNILMVPTMLWTRLVTIHPGEYDDEIAVDLSDFALEETDESRLRERRVATPEYRASASEPEPEPEPAQPEPLYYEALSYVWGSPEDPSSVFVGGGRRVIPITRNLDVAMRHLRYPDRPRVVWIDALCIDQANLGEKSRQVGYMGYVYWSAPRVVVWLGPEADDSHHAMDLLNSVGEKIQVDWKTMAYSCVAEEDEAVWGWRRHERDLPMDDRDWAAVWAFAKRPWFRRIWVRQEVFKAGDEALVYCGRSCISLDLLRRGLYRVTCRNGSIEADTASSVLRPNYFSITDLRYRIRGALCTDPRDYVYGLLFILAEFRPLAITPDYSKSLGEVYQGVVLRHIDTSGNMALLEACGDDPSDPEHSPPPGNIKLPSWVPNWTSGNDVPFYLGITRRFLPFGASTEYIGDGILSAAGVMKAVIRDIVELDATSHLRFSASVRSLVPRDAADSRYPGGGSLWDAYRVALCGNCLKDRTLPPDISAYMDTEDSHNALEGIVHGEEPPESLGDANLWHNTSAEYAMCYQAQLGLQSSRFFIAEDGLMGWAPKQARPGDRVATMLGSQTPTVLRPAPSPGAERYEVVGPCYLHGFMFGEAFLGPFPEGTRPVAHYADEDGNPDHFEFLDTNSGESLLQDPRLGALLTPEQELLWQRGEVRGFIPNVDYLRSVGLDIEYFDLV